VSEFIPTLPPGPADFDFPGDPAENLRALFGNAEVPGAGGPVSGLRLPTDRPAVDAVLAHPDADQPGVAPPVGGQKPQAAPAPASAADRSEGSSRLRRLFLPLAWFLSLTLAGSRGKISEESEERKVKSPRL
jgi:hypothetical protein